MTAAYHFWAAVCWGLVWTVVVMCAIAGAHHLLIGRRRGDTAGDTVPPFEQVVAEFRAEIDAAEHIATWDHEMGDAS